MKSNFTVKKGEFHSNKFAELETYLDNSTQDVIVLSFNQMEDIIGKPLCKSAYLYYAYWVPSPTHTLANSILSSGYDIESVDIISKSIVLKKYN